MTTLTLMKEDTNCSGGTQATAKSSDPRPLVRCRKCNHEISFYCLFRVQMSLLDEFVYDLRDWLKLHNKVVIVLLCPCRCPLTMRLHTINCQLLSSPIPQRKPVGKKRFPFVLMRFSIQLNEFHCWPISFWINPLRRTFFHVSFRADNLVLLFCRQKHLRFE